MNNGYPMGLINKIILSHRTNSRRQNMEELQTYSVKK